ncbi:CapA family protein [Arsenicicoccus dermatophilus]|uniref:CapA family protein n=1 Tax=Arsenicicoccus dermatophilus TaxID=1076331 RepID=UPI003916E9E5
MRSHAPRRWHAPAAGAVVTTLALAVITAGTPVPVPPRPPNAPIEVVDENGHPLPQATVQDRDRRTTSGADGVVPLSVRSGRYVAVSAPGRATRVLGVHPGGSARVVLPPAQSVSLRFAGEVSLGGASRGTTPGDAGRPGPGARDPLSGVRPLLADGTLAAVVLRDPLGLRARPSAPGSPAGGRAPARVSSGPASALRQAAGPRPGPTPHPARQGRPGTPPAPGGTPRPSGGTPRPVPVPTPPPAGPAPADQVATARALKRSGVSVVDLASAHVNDAGAPGLRDTMAALDAAGVRHVGAGRTEDEAWRPLQVPAGGRRIAYVACLIDPGPRPSPRVAQGGRGGAARCSADRLRRTVSRARAAQEDVVVMITGTDGRPDPTAGALQLGTVARQAGAVVVVGQHGAAVGPSALQAGTAVLPGLGTLLADRTSWSSLTGAVQRVDLVAGRPVLVCADPIMSVHGLPQQAPAAVAAAVARFVVGPRATGAVSDSSAATIAAAAPSLPSIETRHVGARSLTRIQPGWSPVAMPPSARAGSDLLLGTGGFEDPGGTGTASWSLSASSRRTNAAACVGAGQDVVAQRGLELVRGPASGADVVVRTAHRLPVTPGERLSLVLSLRHASAGASAELRWFAGGPATTGQRTVAAVPEVSREANDCRGVRVTVTVPAGMTTVQPLLRLRAPRDGVAGARLAVDDVMLIRWSAQGRRPDVVLSPTGGGITLSRDSDSSAESPLDPHWSGTVPEELSATTGGA